MAATCLHVHIRNVVTNSEIDPGPDQPSNPTPTPRNRYDVPFTHNDQLKQLDRYDKLLAFIVACNYKPARRA